MTRYRKSGLERRRSFREPKKRFFIFCEGKITEPAYFLALKKANASTLIDVIPVGVGADPQNITERALSKLEKIGLSLPRREIRSLNSFDENDEVWAVFDKDAHAHYYDSIQHCKKNGINVGYSNPCFEIWLILHEAEYDKSSNRREVQRYFEKIHPAYHHRHGKLPDCDVLVCKVEVAEERAKKQLKRRRIESRRNRLRPPHTTVWRLTYAIRKAAERAKR